MINRLSRNAAMLMAVATLLFVSACGGGGSGGGSGGAPTPTASGVLVDPYIIGAVVQEIAADGTLLQESSRSDSEGRVSFASPLKSGSLLRMKIGENGTHNQTPYAGILQKKVQDAAATQVVSPLTTLLAGGIAESALLAHLAEAGFQGLEAADLHADPMAGIGVNADDRSLLRLQANMAVNAFMAMSGDYQMGPAEIEAGQERLTTAAEMVRMVLNRENFSHFSGSPMVTEVMGGAAHDFQSFVPACVAIIDQAVAGVKTEPSLDPVIEAQIMTEMTPDLMLFYYAQENRGEEAVEAAIDAGQILDMETGDVPVLLARWRESVPGNGYGLNKNKPPVADAGSDQSVTLGTTVLLTGVGSSDPDGDSLRYQWTLHAKPSDSQAALSGPTSVTPTFVADVAGTYEVSLIVNDGTVNSGTDVVTVIAVAPTEPTPTEPTPVIYPAPVLESVQINGTSYVLHWSQQGEAPGGGYDLIIDGIDTDLTHRTTQLNTVVSGLTSGVEHCFQIQGIFTQADPDQLPASNQICVAPVTSPGAVRFSSNYQVVEGEGKVDIIFERVGGSYGPLTVEWRTITFDGYGTADWETDYGTFLWMPVTFADGETRKVLPITINQDTLVEGDEWFTVLLRDPVGGTAVGTPASAVVTIKDDDTALAPAPAPSPTPAMPAGAAKGVADGIGFGVSTSGGRGGVIIRVNTLADNTNPLITNPDGTLSGSLRSALNHNGKRFIVFEVSGRINLTSQLAITRPFVTVAGQTAPPPGITLYGHGLRIGTNDVVIQHIRSRPNNNTSADVDALTIQDFNNDIWNVVIDRCSFGWGPDEVVGPWASYQHGRTVTDLTINNSIIHESIRPSGQGYYGFIIGDRIKRLSAIGNLLAHNGARNPLFKGGSEGIWANNLVYNATEGAFVLFADDYGSGGAKASVVSNIFKRGPSGNPSEIAWFNANTAGKGFQVYQSDNMAKSASGSILNLPWGGTTPSGVMVSSPPVWISGLPLVSAANLENSVFAKAGARSKERGTTWQDANDVRIINEYRTGTGRIPASGFFFTAPTITGQNRAFPLPSSPNADPDGNGYTNIEELLYKMALEVQN